MNRRFTYSLNCLYDNSTLTGQLLQDNTYKYDNVGNIISIDDNGLNARNQYFEYDNINRLIYSKGGMNCQGTGIGYETDYTYSAAGRILKKNVTSQRMNTTAGVYPVDYQNNYTYPSTGNPFAIRSVQDALSGSINNLEWDANGNLIKSSCISGPAYDRRLCWTEDNRLQGYTEYSDENGDISAWYNYAAGGDRNFKITSPSLNMRQNAVGLRYSAHLKYPTLYASALITFNKGGYTKHYFEGTNRMCSKIGGGFSNINLNSIAERVPALAEDYDQLSEGQRESVEHTFNDCLGIAVDVDGIVDLYDVIKHETERDDQEPAFFYHSDHLGSAAYLTNDAGHVTQTLNYLPYGEDWVDIQNNLDPRLGQYRFNGKEKDYESGFHYYGARYYWSEVLTGWLSIDPMSDKYPSISPYAYCAWNPVKLIDPDGRDTAFAGAAERALYLNYREKVFSDDKYKQVQNELIQLEQSSEVFCVRMGENISSSNGGGNFTYNTSTGQFDINIDDDGIWTDIEKLSHELKHADQYLNRKLTLLIDTKGHATFYNYSVDDELEAYNRQGMFGNTWTSEEVYQVYGKQKGLSWYDANRQYTPSSNDINVNAEYQKHLGHPRILYHGWENDVKQRQTR